MNANELLNLQLVHLH